MSSAVSKSHKNVEFMEFSRTLDRYKSLINIEVDGISQQLLKDAKEQFGGQPSQVVDAYLRLLNRGGKRIRGALAIASYEMFGGTNMAMIVKAAAALEILNTYILVADDIQDRSESRRGGDTVHTILAKAHKKNHLKGDSTHFGEALAINSLLIAQHYAANLVLSLDVSETLRIKALNNINSCFMVTAHGQTVDLFSEAVESEDMGTVNNILIWKTAYYTFINPLQLGTILAGADGKSSAGLTKYGINAGKVFQITDDIIGTFGKTLETGKSVLDDIKEGKRTILAVYAIKNSPKTDAYFLKSALGNQNLTAVEFEHCKEIIINSGALDFAKKEASKSAKSAINSLKGYDSNHHSYQFLIDLVNYLLVRKS